MLATFVGPCEPLPPTNSKDPSGSSVLLCPVASVGNWARKGRAGLLLLGVNFDASGFVFETGSLSRIEDASEMMGLTARALHKPIITLSKTSLLITSPIQKELLVGAVDPFMDW
jgi:hypothetical protein